MDLLHEHKVSHHYIDLLLQEGVKTTEDLTLVVEYEELPVGKAMDKATVKKLVSQLPIQTQPLPQNNLRETETSAQTILNREESPPSTSFPRHGNHPPTRLSTFPIANPTPVVDEPPPRCTAAGIVPFFQTRSSTMLLLGYQKRDFSLNSQIHPFGGQIDSGETTKDAAIREFMEECSIQHSHFSTNLRRNLASVLTPKFSRYIGEGKYMAYFLDIDLLSQSNKKVIKELPTMFTSNFEVEKIEWLNLANFSNNRSKTSKSSSQFLQIVLKKFKLFLTTIPPKNISSRPVSEKEPIHYINDSDSDDLIDGLLPTTTETTFRSKPVLTPQFNSALTIQQQLVNEIKESSNIIDFFVSKNWKLELKHPTLPKVTKISPISTISQGDPKYHQLISALPSEMHSTFSSVRTVNVTSRISAFKSEKDRYTQNQAVNDLTVFHGTPESWRATAIALNGFNLSITLHGRALGNGVYTSSDVNVTNSYSGGQGSVLCCKSFVTHNRSNLTPQSSGNIYVFNNPNHVLPTVLYDFQPDTQSSNSSAISVEEVERQRAEQEHRNDIEKMKAEEVQHSQKLKDRYVSLVEKYSQRLTFLKHLFENHKNNQQEVMTLLENEARYFKSSLPIYHHKEEILKAFSNYGLVLLQCDTGSGKSTQLAQYLNDYFLEQSIITNSAKVDGRKIAVLQPRRANAISISTRVAHEMGVTLGEDVGFTIGLGVESTSDSTQIEFLTHGKFQSIASDIKRLLMNYKAVIVDECHLRSIEIDFVLSLLKETFKLAMRDRVTDFKVIVTSATFDQDFGRLLTHFFSSVTSVTSIGFEVPSFPVLLKYVDVFSGDYHNVKDTFGFDYFSNAIVNTAIEMSFKMLKNTSEGNILIFLPSKNSIQRALDTFTAKIHRKHNPEESTENNLDDQHWINHFLQFEYQFKSKQISVGVYAFHGRLTHTERNRVLNASEDRVVIISTDLAETGLTLPNIRYIIDSGFTQTVRWNPLSNVQEMTRELVSKAGANQRKGRAGRTSSGVCIRLYPEQMFNQMSPNIESEISSGFVLRSVLSLLNYRTRCPEFNLLEEIPSDLYDGSIDLLKRVGAIDPDSHKPTQSGQLLLGLGVDFHTALFLIKAMELDCLESAAKISALISCNANSLFVNNNSINRPRYIAKFLHPRGEHATLLNIFNKFLEQKAKSRRRWCRDNDLDFDILAEVDVAYSHLVETLSAKGFEICDNLDPNIGDVHTHIIHALCSSFFDNIAVFRKPGDIKGRFILLSCEEAGSPDSLDVDEKPDNLLTLGTESASLLQSCQVSPDYSFIVFSSRMATARADPESGERSFSNSLSIVSFCTRKDLIQSAPSWRLSSIKNQIKRHRRSTFTIDLSSDTKNMLSATGHYQLRSLRNRLKRATIDLTGNQLTVTTNSGLSNHVKTRINEFLELLTPEPIEFNNLHGIKFGKLIGKNGKDKDDLLKRINGIVSTATSDPQSATLKIDSKRKFIRVTVPKIPNEFISVIIGIVQSQLATCSDASFVADIPDNMTTSPTVSNHLNSNPRLVKLVASIVPTFNSSVSRDDYALLIAHRAIWVLGAQLYGGFVRDYVIRNQSANDIDCLLAPTQNVDNCIRLLTTDLNGFGISAGAPYQKGAAFCVPFQTPSGIVEVDLVVAGSIKTVSPGVDCDCNNLLVDQNGLSLKVNGAGGQLCNLANCVRHANEQKFVFLYPFTNQTMSMCIRRLSKMFNKNFICVSKLPPSIVTQFSSYAHLIKPEDDYSNLSITSRSWEPTKTENL
ncbi:hypothetical protein P9112_005923 [Eukaryota sp. TZLM1-RC]